MEKIEEEDITTNSNNNIDNKSNKKSKEKYFLIKKCAKISNIIISKKTLIRKKIRKINSNPINNNPYSNIILKDNNDMNKLKYSKQIRKKIIVIHFNIIKKLSEHIVNNFNMVFKNKNIEDKKLDTSLYDIWRCLNILSKKIRILKKKAIFKFEKNEFENFYKIKDILLDIKKRLCDNMSKNLRVILNNIERFCNEYTK
jgi:hypothetical protein